MPTVNLYDIVSLAKWDATEPPLRRFGEGKVIRLAAARSQSGIVADIRSDSGRILCGMDIAWLTVVEDGAEDRKNC